MSTAASARRAETVERKPPGARPAAGKASSGARGKDRLRHATAPTAPAALSGPGREMARFLRESHGVACGVFGTTLGPEANEAHRDHFHVDMYPRRNRSYCE